MSIKLASSAVTDIRLGSSYVNSMFLESTLVYSNAFSASGGTVSTFTSGSDTYVYHTFTNSGTLSVTTGATNTAQVLVVGGGAGSPQAGGYFNKGGGGGGANYSQSVSLTSGSYTITIGNGGAINGNGNNSELSGSGLSIVGGGGQTSGVSGTPQSYAAGAAYLSLSNGGGGGAGAIGGDANSQHAGNGGSGLLNSITGTGSYYGAGGGGGTNGYSIGYPSGLGGTNNGGVGGSRTADPGAGTVYGGAAGGNGYYISSGGKTGGKGVVIVTYRQTAQTPTPPPGPPSPLGTILPITASAGTLVLWSDTTSLTSSVLYDKSGNSNNALVSGSTLALTGSNGFAFNGTNNYLNWATNLTATPSSSYTLQYYGVINSGSLNYDFFCKDYYTDGWDTIINTPGAASSSVIFRDTGGADRTSAGFGNSSIKKQIVITVNATTENVELYLDGVYIGVFAGVAFGINNFNDFASPFKFGFNTNGDGTYFKGTLASVALYSKVLSATDVFYNWGALTGSNFS